MILTIYNGGPPLLFFFLYEFTSVAEKIHPRVTTDQQIKWEMW